MRLFIAVWLAEKMKDEVVRYINIAREQIPGFKWSVPEQLHFTLRFLGETPENEINSLNEALENVTRGFTPFELRLGKPGRFPERGNPRILWIGLSKGDKELGNLAGLVEAACAQAGFPAADRPFKPHLTLARAKEGERVLKTLDPTVSWQTGTLVTGFSLVESRLQPGGAVYRRVRDFSFI
ncbi:MAG: RNA 2',3'-cyclic phosphodiesterase [Bacteroidota bacterium]